MKKKSKVLSDNDIEIWKSYTQSIIGKSKTVPKVQKKKKLGSSSPFEKVTRRIKNIQVNFTEPNNTIHLDKKIYSKLKNGQLEPERKLDLHGYNYDSAFSKVKSFIIRSFHDEKRLLLIITGKGKELRRNKDLVFESSGGILKNALPNWLQDAEIKNLVLNITQAHFSHGGKGAYYVYLKKNKLKNESA